MRCNAMQNIVKNFIEHLNQSVTVNIIQWTQKPREENN